MTCADIDGEGGTAFDCSGVATDINASPADVTCAIQTYSPSFGCTCSAAECCTVVTGMCTGNTGGTGDVDCSSETTNTVNKGATVAGTDVAACCEAPVTGMCTGNTGGTGDVTCSAGQTHKGAIEGTDAAACCEDVTGMCSGNKDGTGDVDCSSETTNTVNKGATVAGTDVAACCEAPPCLVTGMC